MSAGKVRATVRIDVHLPGRAGDPPGRIRAGVTGDGLTGTELVSGSCPATIRA
jgi:hypothetical protein